MRTQATNEPEPRRMLVRALKSAAAAIAVAIALAGMPMSGLYAQSALAQSALAQSASAQSASAQGTLAQSTGATSSSITPEQLLQDGVKAFGKGDYSTALARFRELTIHPNNPAFAAYAADGFFWVGKTALALNRLDEAQHNIEYFLLHFPHQPAYPEANYLRARILFLQRDYQAAIQAFQDFIAKFPSSPFIANAYYWSGESLYDLGQFESAKKLFMAVVQHYPTSYRVEAAQYRLSLIAQKKREEELLKLLQWSHEESLRALAEFQRREKTYQEAIEAYQKQLSGKSSNGLSKEVARLGEQMKELQNTLSQREKTVQELKQENEDLRAQLKDAGVQLTPQVLSSGQRNKLLDMQQEAKDLKQFFQNQINSRKGGAQ